MLLISLSFENLTSCNWHNKANATVSRTPSLILSSDLSYHLTTLTYYSERSSLL